MVNFNCYGADNDTLKWSFEYMLLKFLLRCTPNKVRWKIKNSSPFLKKKVHDAACLKNIFFRRLLTRIRCQRHVARDPGGGHFHDGDGDVPLDRV